ncbi:polysaccharide biosynthesis protein [Halovulum sp. GXIMD14794]
MRPDATGTRLSLLMAAVQGAAALTGVAGTLLLSRLMGDEGFGRAMLMVSLATLGAVAVTGNLDAVAMRALNTGTTAARAAFLRLCRRTIGAGGALCLLICSLLWAYGFLSLQTLLVFPAAVVLLGLLRTTARQGAALGRPGVAVTVRLLARPLSFLAFGCLCLVTGVHPPEWAPTAVLAGACAAGVGLQVLALSQVLRPLAQCTPEAGHAAGWLRAGAALAPALLMQELLRDLVLVSAGWTLDGASLGVLALALTLAALPGLAVTAVEIALGPRIGRAAASLDRGPLKEALGQSALLRIFGLATALVGLALVLPIALRLAGAPYTQPLVWTLIAIPVTRALLGNPTMLLAASGHVAPVGRISAIGASLTALTVAVAGLHWDAKGAALGAMLGSSATTAWLWATALRITGQDCSVLCLLRTTSRAAAR